MKILIAYATTEGQTRKIARFVANELIEARHSVELLEALDDDALELDRFDAAILAGSVHMEAFQSNLAGFVRRHTGLLNTKPTLFLAVSLTAAGKDAKDWEGLDALTAAFLKDTGWRPDRVEHVAGALRFSEYDFFKSWIMRRLAAERGETVNPREDKEFTDWGALRACLTEWAHPLADAI